VGGGGREGVDQAVERRVVVVAKLGFSDVDGGSTGGAVRWWGHRLYHGDGRAASHIKD
jgi:hypothetical protein